MRSEAPTRKTTKRSDCQDESLGEKQCAPVITNAWTMLKMHTARRTLVLVVPSPGRGAISFADILISAKLTAPSTANTHRRLSDESQGKSAAVATKHTIMMIADSSCGFGTRRCVTQRSSRRTSKRAAAIVGRTRPESLCFKAVDNMSASSSSQLLLLLPGARRSGESQFAGDCIGGGGSVDGRAAARFTAQPQAARTLR